MKIDQEFHKNQLQMVSATLGEIRKGSKNYPVKITLLGTLRETLAIARPSC
jgi:hypothetical protein